MRWRKPRRRGVAQIGAGNGLAHLRDSRQARPRSAGSPRHGLRPRAHARHRVRRRSAREAGFRPRRRSCRLLLFRRPCRTQHGAGAREAGHHGADRRRDDVGDFAVRKIVDFTQHEGLPERLGERMRPVCRIADASRSRSICVSGVSCASCHSGVCSASSGRSSSAAVGEPARRANSARQTLRRIANSQGFIAGPAIAVEMLQRAQIAFLHRVLGVGRRRAADSAPACRRRRDRAARRRESAAPFRIVVRSD